MKIIPHLIIKKAGNLQRGDILYTAFRTHGPEMHKLLILSAEFNPNYRDAMDLKCTKLGTGEDHSFCAHPDQPLLIYVCDVKAKRKHHD